jgi:DNA-binding transcriptional LysR family regulator
VELADLRVFAMVAAERSFSRAAQKLHRTQPAVSQAVRRLEERVGERLFDRTFRDGTLTEAGRVLLDHAQRLLRMADAATAAVLELKELQRGRVVIGANEAAVHSLLPFIHRFGQDYPGAQVDVRRVPSRQIGLEVLQRTLDFGVLTFQPAEKGLATIALGRDELVMLTHPAHPLANRSQITMEELGRQTIIAHNDPSPARDRVLRLYERRHADLNIRIALPSLDSIKRAVEMGTGVALLPRRCALTELARAQLMAVRVPELQSPRQVRLIYRRSGELSHAAGAFLELVKDPRYGSALATPSTSS